LHLNLKIEKIHIRENDLFDIFSHEKKINILANPQDNRNKGERKKNYKKVPLKKFYKIHKRERELR
jgi:hypothetical protein